MVGKWWRDLGSWGQVPVWTEELQVHGEEVLGGAAWAFPKLLVPSQKGKATEAQPRRPENQGISTRQTTWQGEQ